MNFQKILIPPTNYKRSLYDHQKTSVFYMEKLEEEKYINIDDLYTIDTKFGILSDKTGYGKTISIIALICRDKKDWNVDIDEEVCQLHAYHSSYSIIRKSSHKRIKTNLIIASQTIIHQWENELKLTNLKFKVVKTKKVVKTININDYDVIIIVPSMYNDLIRRYKYYCWKRVIYDEPQTTYIAKMYDIYTGFLWFITATPNSFKNRYSNRNHFHYISKLQLDQLEPLFFRKLQVKNNDEYVDESFTMPRVFHKEYYCFLPIISAISPFLTPRLKLLIESGNIRGAIQLLGGKETDDIISLVKNRIEEDIIEAKHKIDKYTRRGNEETVEFWKQKKTKAEKEMKSVTERLEKYHSQNCVICREGPIQNAVLLPCCQNILCGKCVLSWLNQKQTCPLCRSDLGANDLIYVNNTNSLYSPAILQNTKPRENTKIEEILNIIKLAYSNNNNKKFIICSEDDISFKSIINSFRDTNYICKLIQGSATKRKNIINSFINDKSVILLLNSKTNSAGVNLQMCTDIILYHEMSEETLIQLLGRANRIGRKEPLYVHHLKTKEVI